MANQRQKARHGGVKKRRFLKGKGRVRRPVVFRTRSPNICRSSHSWTPFVLESERIGRVLCARTGGYVGDPGDARIVCDSSLRLVGGGRATGCGGRSRPHAC